MRKIGKLSLSSCSEPYYVIDMMGKNGAERIDVISRIQDYQPFNTINCVASCIYDKQVYVFGDNSIINAIMKIKQDATLLHVPDKRDVRVEDGKFILVTLKENPGTSILYKTEMTNGEYSFEYYQTSMGSIEYTEFSMVDYTNKDKPINWDSYETKSVGISSIKTTSTTTYYSYDELLRMYPQVSHVLEENYVIVESYEQAEERLQDWIDSKEQLKSYDIESISTDWGPYSTNRITGVFLGYGEHTSTYFPFRQENFEYNLPMEFLSKIFKAINTQPEFPQVILLAHNGKFELEGFYQEYREFPRMDIDTFILSVLVDPLVKKGTHTLKNLTAKVDSRFYLTLEQIFKGPVQFNVLPKEIVKLYGCPDATSPAKIYKYLMSKLPKDETFVMKLEMRLPQIKALQEFYGMKLDFDRLNKLIENETYVVEMLSDMFKRIHRTSQNINSGPVLADILYNKLKCKVEVYTKKHEPSTSKEAIDKIVKSGAQSIPDGAVIPKDIVDKNGHVVIAGKTLAANKYPSLIIYQEYKKAVKELGALNRLKDHSSHEFFKFYINQVGAGSNRQTSDAHQFSDTMKSCAIADTKYHQLVSCDWKQVELRILAGMAKQEDLIELERDSEVDIHRAILSIIQGKPMYMISEEDRKKGKSVNFGVVYGMTEYGLALRDYGPGYTKENLREEQKKITDFFNGLPNVKAFIKSTADGLMRNGYVKTAFNYYRYFPELLDPACDKKLVKKYLKAGGNTPIQGTGAQMLKIVETNIYKYIKNHGWDKEKDYDGEKLPMVRMILPIHDEILLSYDKEIPIEEIITMFKECMELDIDGMPPFFAAPAFINNWYDGKNSAFEIDIPYRDKIVEEYKHGTKLLSGRNYLDEIANYRSSELKSYMDELILKYKTKEEVAEHVTHDSLTHTLIETMIPSKGERKALSHKERIKEAVNRYFDKNSVVVKEIQDDSDDNVSYVDFDDWSENYVSITPDGDVQVENDNSDDDYYNYEVTDIETDMGDEYDPVVFLLNECIIDITDLDIKTNGEVFYQELRKIAKPNGYYNVVLVSGIKTVKTDINIDYCPDDIKSLLEKVKEL